MSQPNRYPSPDPGNSSHPYHSNQPAIAPDVAPQLQPAPTAMMQDSAEQNNTMTQNFQYISSFSANPTSTPQQMAQQGLEVNTDSPSKKRNKVSRACDECRRKKVRCDAETDHPGTQCANCKRANLTCQFSRQPQKRGPSKGYIKELADRVTRLEYTPSSDMQYGVNQEAQGYSPQLDLQAGGQRKRSHSMVDGNYLSGAEQLQDYARGSAPSGNASMVPAPTHSLPESSGDSVMGIPPALLEGYYSHIHPMTPILPENQNQLSAYLEQATPDVRHAFNAALTVAIRAATTAVHPSDLKLASDLHLATRPRSGSSPADLVRLQTLIFMTLADEMNGPASSREASWLGSAITMASSLHLNRPNHERDGTLRRAWLALVVLDRWHAVSVCGQPLITDEQIHLDETDHALLGSSAYHALRISIALGHLASVFLVHDQDFVTQRPTSRPILQLMKGEVDRIAESVQPMLAQLPLVHLALLHLQILSLKATEPFYASDRPVIDAAKHVVAILNSEKTPSSPLEHHQITLAAAVLGQTVAVDPQGQSLEELRQAAESRLPPAWRGSVVGYIDSKLNAHKNANGKGGARGMLQHLADAAVGANRDKEAGEVDWSGVLVKGYLSLYD